MCEHGTQLTIFTPTYNRAYILPKLYESLVGQSSKDFEWLIVDDGSTDNTRELVNQWIQDNQIHIRYLYQENAGKQIAMNLGADNCSTSLFDCVDSDDYLVPNAVESILDFWMNNKNEQVAGIVSLRGKTESESITGKYMPQGVSQCHFVELYEKHKFSGDTNLVYRTDIIKKFPYKVFPGEKFIGESAQYLQIDREYQMLLMDKITVICEYIEDGYTKNVYSLLKKNPKGYRYLKGLDFTMHHSLKNKYLEMIKYCSADIMCKDHKGFGESPSKFAYILAYFPGVLAYIRYFKNA